MRTHRIGATGLTPPAFEADQPIPPHNELTGINGVRFISPDRSASAFLMRHVFGCALHDQREVGWAKRIFNHCGGAFMGWEKPLKTPSGEAGSVHHMPLSCPRDRLETLHTRLREVTNRFRRYLVD